MLLVFLGVLLAANLALGAVGHFFPDLPIPSAMGIVLAMAAAIGAGQSGTKAVNRHLTFGEKVTFSVVATVLSVALGIGLFWGLFAYHGVPLTPENFVFAMTGDAATGAEILQILTWVAPIVLVIYLLITYLGVAMGSRQQMKLQEKLTAQGK
jgi:hypothetical protein